MKRLGKATDATEAADLLQSRGMDLPPEPWRPLAVREHRPVRHVPFGPRPKPRREVVTEVDDDGQPIAWRRLSDEELAAWQAEYDADPDKHGGTAVVRDAPGPTEVTFEHMPTGSRARAYWADGRWLAVETELRGGREAGFADTSWLEGG